MFGRGIYLNDCFSKAASQSFFQNEDGNNYGVVFLVEAALGDMHKSYEPN